jgi:hypothetical protein
MLARCSVLSLPPPASGLRELLLHKYSHPPNRLESTLLQVFIPGNLKPFAINSFEKQGGGSPLWLTKYHKKVSPAADRLLARQASLPFSVHTSKFRIPQVLHLQLLRKHRGWGVLPILEPLLQCHPGPAGGGSAFSFLATRHSSLATFFPDPSSTGAAMIARTRSRKAGTSSLVRPLVSMVSCR